jgi:hypothetical protein
MLANFYILVLPSVIVCRMNKWQQKIVFLFLMALCLQWDPFQHNDHFIASLAAHLPPDGP